MGGTGKETQIIDVCISALFSLIENTSFDISDGLISTMVKKQDIIGVINVLRLYLSKIPHGRRAEIGRKLLAVKDALENSIISAGEVESYTHLTGQSKQSVTRLSFDKIVSAQKKIEKIIEQAGISPQSDAVAIFG